MLSKDWMNEIQVLLEMHLIPVHKKVASYYRFPHSNSLLQHIRHKNGIISAIVKVMLKEVNHLSNSLSMKFISTILGQVQACRTCWNKGEIA